MQPMPFTCSQCNAPLPAGVTQCPNCGMQFAAPVPPQPGYGAPAPGYPPQPPYGYGQPQPQKRGLGAGAIIAIVCAVGCLPVLAIIAAILFPVFAQARTKARVVVSQSNLKQIGLATLQYEQDHNEMLPPMDSIDHYKAALSKYLLQSDPSKMFIEPGVNVPYKINSQLTGKYLGNLTNPSQIVMLEESQPISGQMIDVLYADGHVESVPQSGGSTGP